MGFLEELPIVPKCCCCIANLRFGNIAIGAVSLCAFTITYTERMVYVIRHVDYSISVTDEQVYLILGLWFLLLVYIMPKIVLNIVLIIGAVKKKSTLLQIYLWCNLVYMAFEGLTIIGVLATLFTSNDIMSWEIFMTFLLMFMFHLYFWICVDSYFVELRLENRFSLRQQMRGTTLTNIQFSSPHSASIRSRQQSFSLQRIIRSPPHTSNPPS